MTSLVDIGPLRDNVNIRGRDFEVRPLSALLIFDMLRDNDSIKKMIMGGTMNAQNVMALVDSSPQLIGQIIASTLGEHGKPETIDFAMRELTLEEQAEVIQKAIKISFPKGLQSFFNTLTALISDDSNRSVSSRGAAAAMTSPQQSPAA